MMCVWFIVLGVTDAVNIGGHPAMLRAFSPWYAVGFFAHHGTGGFVVLGVVVLCVTGTEALHMDMGHLAGRRSASPGMAS